jgi:dipeptidyl aminopeptidase/acylaminoacyl peptidase
MMSRIFCILASLLCGVLPAAGAPAARLERGNLVFDNLAVPTADSVSRIGAYLGGREAGVLGWSPQGALLIATRFGEATQLHLVERAGGERRQLTFANEPIATGAFSPDPTRGAFLYLEDSGGNGKFELFYQRLGEAAARRLSDGASVNLAPVWSNAGRDVAFASSSRDGRSMDIDIVAPESGALPHLAVGGAGGAWYPLDWSPDDSQLLALEYVSRRESHLFLVDLDTGKKRELDTGVAGAGSGGGSGAPAAITAARFARDGQGAYLISDRDAEFKQLRFVNFFKPQSVLLSGHVASDIDEIALSRDGHYLAFVSNEGGSDQLQLLDLVAHQDLTPPRLPVSGRIDSLYFDTEGKRLAFSAGGTTAPRDAYVLDVAANKVERWTDSEAGAVDVQHFVVPREVGYPSFDREVNHARDVPAYVYEPVSPGPHPVLVLLLGSGEQREFRPGFDPWIQYLVTELGFAVIAPNLRGASGYGKSYAAQGEGRAREDAVKDIGALLVWLRAQGNFDAEHVVIAGQGYGGYLALEALANFGDRLRGAIDFGGITDFVALLTDAPAYAQDERRRRFGDERDPDTRAYLRRISPLTNPERIAKPVLIVQGKNDPDVPETQSQDMVNRLRSRGADVRLLLADDEGGDFRQRRNRVIYCAVVAEFLQSLR